MANSDSSAGSPARNPRKCPLPGAEVIDEMIAARLAEFDAVPRPVRDAAWTIALIVYDLSAPRALALLAVAAELRETEWQENPPPA